MGIGYYAVNDTKKQAYELGKFSGIYDYVDEMVAAGNDAVKMRSVLLDLSETCNKEYLRKEPYLSHLAKGLAVMGIERLWNDSSGDVDDIEEYLVVGSRYTGVVVKDGERVGDSYGRFELD